MLPAELGEQSFAAYPPEARALAVQQLRLFRQLPLSFLPLFLRELVDYDWKFPAERREIQRQLDFLSHQTDASLTQSMTSFTSLRLTPELALVDWVNVPADFSERLSAYLWSSHQIDAFRSASVEYIHRVNEAQPASLPAINRLGLVLIGAGADGAHTELFRLLRPHGVYYGNVDPREGRTVVVEMLNRRAQSHSAPFAHWCIDGASGQLSSPACTSISYNDLKPVCRELQARMVKVMGPGGGGPEVLRSELQRMKPEDVGLTGPSPALNRFQLSLLTEGSGTQIFSTSFVQWAAREALRRAQPDTLLARFAPRRREASIAMPSPDSVEALDPEASLIDADMGAYYTWLNQQRLAGAQTASFVVWHEGHNRAVAIGPSLRAGTEEKRPVKVNDILAAVTA